jgi:hypothetical protein
VDTGLPSPQLIVYDEMEASNDGGVASEIEILPPAAPVTHFTKYSWPWKIVN